MGADAGLSECHWTELGTTVRQIHASQLPSDLISIVPHESFIPSRREVMTQLQTAIDSHAGYGPVQHELAEFWNSRQEKVRALVERADVLAYQLRTAPLLNHGKVTGLHA